ncbi:MAG: DUF423 domain-containing protein [Flavobacteriales bacterium]|nr:DUF423 domain-containing protein [Flavobacteriales bacterium]
MDRTSVAWGSGLLLIAVGFGAFGAHGLSAVLPNEALAQWQTAVQYQFHHGLGLLLVAALAGKLPDRALQKVRRSLLFGTLFFCGSIYVLSTRELTGLSGMAGILGPITPLGGLFFLLGWGHLLITALRGSDMR